MNRNSWHDYKWDKYKIYEKGKKPRIPYKAPDDDKCQYCKEKHDYEHSALYIRLYKQGKL